MSERELISQSPDDKQVLKLEFLRNNENPSNVRLVISTDVRVRGDLRTTPHLAKKPDRKVFTMAERLMKETIRQLQNCGIVTAWKAPGVHAPIRSQQNFKLEAPITVGSRSDEEIGAIFAAALTAAKEQLGDELYANTSDKQAGKML